MTLPARGLDKQRLATVQLYATAMRRCVYCGRVTKRPIACDAHSDVPPLDPHYSMRGPA
jgi:hypothetical protein